MRRWPELTNLNPTTLRTPPGVVQPALRGGDHMKHRIAMSAGSEPADILITNARVVDVFSGLVRQDSVAIGDGVFLGFGQREAREVVDARGAYLLPGFIDAHIHLESSMVTPARFAEMALPHGTTSVVADPHELANVCGTAALRFLLASAQSLPLNIFVALPSCVPATPFEDSGAVLKAEDLAPFMDSPHVASLGEMMNYPGVLGGDPEVLDKLALSRAHRKPVDGHAPALLGKELDAYLCTGIANTHECTTAEEFHQNLMRGCRIFLRDGSAARNLPALAPLVTPGNCHRCAFCCDDRHASELLTAGHMDEVLRKAVALGMDPVMAVRLCTLNAAEAEGLQGKGAIAPGFDADCVLVDDLASFNVRMTIAGGRPIAAQGRMLVQLQDPPLNDLTDTVRLAPLAEDVLALPVPSGRARVIRLHPGSLVTDAEEHDVACANGLFDARLNKGLCKLAVFERHKATGKVGVGILAGYGLCGAAVATSVSHDSHNIVVCGDNDADMLAAVRRVADMGGGIAVTSNGRVLADLPLPVAGLMTHQSPETVVRALDAIHNLLHDHGIPENVAPLMALSFMALPVIPSLKLTARGLFSVAEWRFVSVDAATRH